MNRTDSTECLIQWPARISHGLTVPQLAEPAVAGTSTFDGAGVPLSVDAEPLAPI
jgi:hypothetical protein